jgi:hypothetical protein
MERRPRCKNLNANNLPCDEKLRAVIEDHDEIIRLADAGRLRAWCPLCQEVAISPAEQQMLAEIARKMLES